MSTTANHTTATVELPEWAELLKRGTLPCASCGVAVRLDHDADHDAEVIELESAAHGVALALAARLPATFGGGPRGRVWRFARCAECRARAAAISEQGIELPIDVLDGLGAAGAPKPKHLTGEWADALVRQLSLLSEDLGYVNMFVPFELVPNVPPTEAVASTEPWGWLPAGVRDALRVAYGRYLAERVAAGQPPVQVPPPGDWDGCLLCGVGGIELPARQVAAAGGLEEAQTLVWTPVKVSPAALLGSGPGLLDGAVCPACSDAIRKARGIVGGRAIELAIIAYLRSVGLGEFAAVTELDLGPRAGGIDVELVAAGWGGLAASRAARADRAARGEAVRGSTEPIAANTRPWEHLGIEDEARRWTEQGQATRGKRGGGHRGGN